MPISLRDELVEIYEAAVASLAGDRLVREHLAARRAELPKAPTEIVAIALGKAAGAMAQGAVDVLGPLGGVAVGPAGMSAPPGFEVVPGDHPVPGPRSIRAGFRLLSFVRSIRRNQTALVLLSGGGSALAEALPAALSLPELAQTTKLLLAAGAPIEEMNVLRKHLSRVKGGRLAAACTAARGEILAISDVEGDDLGTIASGPFTPDPSTYADARAIVAARGLEASLPTQVTAWLRGERDESPKPGNPIFDRWTSAVLAGPASLAEAARREGEARGFRVISSTGFSKGLVEDVARGYGSWLDESPGKRVLLVSAGEPTVHLPPHPGRGGRSQQLGLLMAGEFDRRRATDAAFLAAGSDGRDGMSNNAGAVVDAATAERGRAQGFDLEDAIRMAASSAACDAVGASIPAFDSRTNVADLHLLAVG